MVSVRQRSADFFVRYAIVEADRQGVTGPYAICFEFDGLEWFITIKISSCGYVNKIKKII